MGARFPTAAPDEQFRGDRRERGCRYVKDGIRSALVRPLGGYSKTTTPYFYIPMESSLFGYNYVDFNVVQSFTADVYNAESSEVAMKAGVITMITDYESADLARGERIYPQTGLE